MKICQITYSGFGGLGSVVFSLISGDQNFNHSWPIGFIGEKPLDKFYRKHSSNLGLDYKNFQFKPKKHFLAWLNLYKWLSQIKPDVIICHTLNPIFVCKIYSILFSIPLVSVAHTSNIVKPWNEKIMSFFSIFLSHKIILLTEEYKSQLENTYGIFFPSKKIKVIPNGIDLSVFFPSTKKIQKRKKYKIGMAGRFSSSKKQDLLILAIQKIFFKYPELDIELHLAGDGENIDYLKKLALNLSGSSNIIFNGLLNEIDIGPWMRELDIYVHATEGETLSTSLLQAMASSLPIIASDVSGVKNLVGINDDFGYCVPNKAELFSEKIIDLILAIKDGKNINLLSPRKYVEKNYSHLLMHQRYIQLITEISLSKK